MMITALILLPLFYNPDKKGNRKPIEEEKFLTTANEIAQQFGGGVLWMYRDSPPEGFWWDKGIVDRDQLCFIEVDVADDEESRSRLRSYVSNVLLKRFKQKAIYIKLYKVETLLIGGEDLKVER